MVDSGADIEELKALPLHGDFKFLRTWEIYKGIVVTNLIMVFLVNELFQCLLWSMVLVKRSS